MAPSPKNVIATPPVFWYLHGEAHPDADRDLPADDAVTAIEMLLDVEKVHRAALAARAAVDLAEQLGHARLGAHAARERQPVVAVGRDDGVVGAGGPDGAGGDGLLADVEVEEAGDLLPPVHLGRALLEAALEQHVAVHRQHVVGAQAEALVRVPAVPVDPDVGEVGLEVVGRGGRTGRHALVVGGRRRRSGFSAVEVKSAMRSERAAGEESEPAAGGGDPPAGRKLALPRQRTHLWTGGSALGFHARAPSAVPAGNGVFCLLAPIPCPAPSSLLPTPTSASAPWSSCRPTTRRPPSRPSSSVCWVWRASFRSWSSTTARRTGPGGSSPSLRRQHPTRVGLLQRSGKLGTRDGLPRRLP